MPHVEVAVRVRPLKPDESANDRVYTCTQGPDKRGLKAVRLTVDDAAVGLQAGAGQDEVAAKRRVRRGSVNAAVGGGGGPPGSKPRARKRRTSVADLVSGGADDEHEEFQYLVDHTFFQTDKNDVVFDAIGERMLDKAFAGYNSTMLAYGQTGSGKTHTMMGYEDRDDDPGICPRLVQRLYERVGELQAAGNEVEVCVECVEIYGKEELLTDLLVQDAARRGDHLAAAEELQVRQDTDGSFYVDGLSIFQPTTVEEMTMFIQASAAARATSATAMNRDSSRSHSLLTISVNQLLPSLDEDGEEIGETRRTARIHLVDLAGSENLNRSQAVGQRAKEAAGINSSLLVLRKVLDALVEGEKFVPYRDSALTKLLSASLGGNCVTTIVATVSPARADAIESKSTLSYAAKARKIKTQVTANESNSKRKVRSLEKEVERLRRQVEEATAGANSAALQDAERLLEAERLQNSAANAKLLADRKATAERLQALESSHEKHKAERKKFTQESEEHATLLQLKKERAAAKEQKLCDWEQRLIEWEARLNEREAAIADKEKQEAASIVLQAVCRQHLVSKAFNFKMTVVRLLQPERERAELNRRKAMQNLQRWARGWLARKEAERGRQAIVAKQEAVVFEKLQIVEEARKAEEEADRREFEAWKREAAEAAPAKRAADVQAAKEAKLGGPHAEHKRREHAKRAAAAGPRFQADEQTYLAMRQNELDQKAQSKRKSSFRSVGAVLDTSMHQMDQLFDGIGAQADASPQSISMMSQGSMDQWNGPMAEQLQRSPQSVHSSPPRARASGRMAAPARRRALSGRNDGVRSAMDVQAPPARLQPLQSQSSDPNMGLGLALGGNARVSGSSRSNAPAGGRRERGAVAGARMGRAAPASGRLPAIRGR